MTYNNLLHHDGHLFVGKILNPAPSPYSQASDLDGPSASSTLVGEHDWGATYGNRWGACLAYVHKALDAEAGYYLRGYGVAEYGVVWEPADGGAFPRLRGNLRAQSAGDPSAFLLVTDGSYATSAGGAAHSCESATGHRIAQATARDMLSYIGDSLERSYREREN